MGDNGPRMSLNYRPFGGSISLYPSLNVSNSEKIQTCKYSVVVIGNPNVGKTTIFNDLTSSHERVANYSGITHSVKSGVFFDNLGYRHRVYDLPGMYGMSAYTAEEYAIFELLYGAGDQTRILFVLDAQHLERNLFLGTQILELGLPVCFAVTFSEQAEKSGHVIDWKFLEKALQAPIVLLSSHISVRQRQLRDVITRDHFRKISNFQIGFLQTEQLDLEELAKVTGLQKGLCQLFLLQESARRKKLTCGKEIYFTQMQAKLNKKDPHWQTRLISARYAWIEALLMQCVQHVPISRPIVNWDNLFLHRFFGPISLGIFFFLLLWSIFIVSEYPTRACEWGIEWLQFWIQNHLPENWFRNLLNEGIVGGVGNVLLFLPQFVLMTACLGIFENIGYLARVTFLLDRWMQKIGLSGSSFVVLISCYACTIPGIMQTRCVHNREERLTTLFVAPWVNCNSRVPIYLLFITMLFTNMSPWQKTMIIILIYVAGLLAALILAAIIRKFFLRTRYTVHIAEMPPLLRPQPAYIFQLIKSQTIFFLKKAGISVLAFSIILWFCLHTKITNLNGESADCVHWVGQKLEKVLRPIGFDGNLGISLLSAFGARENFIATLGVLYNVDSKEPGSLREQLQQAVNSQGQPIYTLATCVSLILFFMFSLQCIGTFVLVKQETHSWRLTLFQFVFMNAFAYSLCFIVYRALS